MKWTRYEILLPLRYNDGQAVERGKFRQTNLELLQRYSVTTSDLITPVGAWKYRGTQYEGVLMRLIIHVPSSSNADEFFRNYKETLKTRFQQTDIWITGHEMEIL